MAKLRWPVAALVLLMVSAQGHAWDESQVTRITDLTRCVILDEATIYRTLKEGRIVQCPGLGWAFESRLVEEGRLIDVTGKLRDGAGLSYTFRAREAEVRFDMRGRKLFMYLKKLEVSCEDGWRMWAEDRVWEFDLP